MRINEGVRAPAVAGRFYSDDAGKLQQQVDGFLDAADSADKAPKAVIAPHAGFMFSGAVAGLAYGRLRPARGTVERVVVLGPSHFVPIRGLAAPDVNWLRTPLGDMPVDTDGVAEALEHPEVTVDNNPHAHEHSLETQLPFIQRALGAVPVVPLVVGDATTYEVGRVLAALWGGGETIIAISSDLSHFHDDATARALDRSTADAIEARDHEAMSPDRACGFMPIAGTLWNAIGRELQPRTLALRNSGDAGAPRDSVVGYGAFEIPGAA